jgi:2-C-methyl-D-erythritol 4-phosphate cytidylyltransferase
MGMMGMDERPSTEFEERPELIKKRARTFAVQGFVIALLITLAAIALVILVVSAVQGAQTRQQLLDCTQPVGKCFQQGQSRQGEVVKQLIDANATDEETTRQIIILTEGCSASVDQKLVRDARIRAIEDCVNEELTRVEKKEKAEGDK